MKKKYPGLTRLIKKEEVPLKRRHYPEAISRPTGANEKGLLLRHPNFVAKSPNARREPSPLECEASALTTELTAPNPVENPPNQEVFPSLQIRKSNAPCLVLDGIIYK